MDWVWGAPGAAWAWIAGLEWGAFFPTLLATVAGALIGVFGVWYGFRLQRDASYVTRFDDAIANLLGEVASRATAIREHQAAVQHAYNFPREVGMWRVPVSPDAPDDFALSIAVDVAEMRARGADQDVMLTVRRAYDAISTSPDLDGQARALGLFGGALSRWRSAIWSIDMVLESLNRIPLLVRTNNLESDE